MSIKLLQTLLSRFVTGEETAGSADIIFSSYDNKTRVILPVVPADLPEFKNAQNNDHFQSVIADFSVIGTPALRTTSFDFFAPSKAEKYSFCRSNGSTASAIINFFERTQLEKTPIRLTIVYTNGSTYANMTCLVNSFSYRLDRVGDFHFSVDLIEYRVYSQATGGIYS